ncbi:MAG: DUF5343 domain-containing protein [Pseudomonadota bacterium]
MSVKITMKEEPKRTPPVLAWRTLLNFFRSLKQGIPSRIDRSVMRSQSGLGQTQILHALKYLNLIDEDGTPSPKLAQLVKSEGAEYQKVLREVLTSAYSFLRDLNFDLKNATHNQLAERFQKLASGDTVRKCMTFFIPAAKEAGIEMSPFIKEVGKRTPSNGKPRKAKPAIKDEHREQERHHEQEHVVLSWHELLLTKFPSFDPTWPDDVKSKWFDNFAALRVAGEKKS